MGGLGSPGPPGGYGTENDRMRERLKVITVHNKERTNKQMHVNQKSVAYVADQLIIITLSLSEPHRAGAEICIFIYYNMYILLYTSQITIY